MRPGRRLPLVLSLALAMGSLSSGIGRAGPDAPAHGVTSAWVEHVKFVPFEAYGATSAKLVGNYFYVSSLRSISIYDVTNREDPQLMSVTPLPSMWENEDLATNGKILIYSQTGNVPLLGVGQNALHVWNVENKAAPVEIATLSGAGQHTMTCINDCTYLYGSSGSIIDLRNPSAPANVGNWVSRVGGGTGGAHDVREVAPGITVASNPQGTIMDTTDPLNPKKLSAISGPKPPALIHSSTWPNSADDRFMLMGNESNLTGRCGTSNGATSTWDMTGWRDGGYRLVDQKQARNGFLFDGNAPANVGGCSAHWLEASPSFHNGGIFSQGYYDHGARFFYVNGAGKLTEAGFYQQPYGWTSATYWVTDRIVYAMDYIRGFDILRWNGPLPRDPAASNAVTELSASRSGSTASVTGKATFAGEATASVLADDVTGDGPIEPGTAGTAGVDLTQATIRQPEAGLPFLEFTWKVASMPTPDTTPGAPPETVWYVANFNANNKPYRVQAKLTNVASTTVADDPSGGATHVGRAFQLRGNCAVLVAVNNCGHLAWLDGRFDQSSKLIQVRIPLNLANAPDLRPGVTLTPTNASTAAPNIYAAYNVGVTQFSPVSMADGADWFSDTEGAGYTIPASTVTLGAAPAGTDSTQVTYSTAATLAADGSFTGALSGVPAGSEIFAKSCFGTSCSTRSVGIA